MNAFVLLRNEIDQNAALEKVWALAPKAWMPAMVGMTSGMARG
jgi:hypothetical protein